VQVRATNQSWEFVANQLIVPDPCYPSCCIMISIDEHSPQRFALWK
jgi:hypothetical protein